MLVPAFVNWPAKLKPRTEDAVLCALDWLPTLAALTGAEISRSDPLDGRNVWPLLTGEAKGDARTIFWRTSKQSAIREGDWKLVTTKDGDDALFNLKDDPFEKMDLAAAQPELAKSIGKKLKSWRQELPESEKKKSK